MNTTMHKLIKTITDLELLTLALLCVGSKEGIRGKLFLQKGVFLTKNFIMRGDKK